MSSLKTHSDQLLVIVVYNMDPSTLTFWVKGQQCHKTEQLVHLTVTVHNVILPIAAGYESSSLSQGLSQSAGVIGYG